MTRYVCCVVLCCVVFCCVVCCLPSQKCQFKCGSVGGMQYHYLRCTGKSPQFKCDHCPRKYESRTGLNYHIANHHDSTLVEEVKVSGGVASGMGGEEGFLLVREG